MALRRLRLKLLVIAAIIITSVAVYYRITWSRGTFGQEEENKEKDVNDIRPPAKGSKNFDSVKDLNPLNEFKPVKNEDKESLYQKALSINFEQKMHNVDKFGNHQQNSIIFAVQVHDRAEYFKEFLFSLKAVVGVADATLLISMDKNVPQVEIAIKEIDFCRYMIIFFPFSMQLFPSTFPGKDANDCPRDMPKSQAVASQCNNAEYPDMYGHYREVKYVQTKHHFLWKLHMVFSGIRAFANNQAPVILLEEDYYVVPDVIHCAKQAVDLKSEKCSKCGLISLGNYSPTQDYSANNQVEIHAWTSSRDNMGMVITRELYNSISDCMEKICDYDDYNWDWSLQAGLKNCIPSKLYTMQFKATRVYHLGTCEGMHSHKNCNINDEVKHIQSNIGYDLLFPESLHVAMDNPVPAPMPRPNGGWGDLRDRSLCKQYKSLAASVNAS